MSCSAGNFIPGFPDIQATSMHTYIFNIRYSARNAQKCLLVFKFTWRMHVPKAKISEIELCICLLIILFLNMSFFMFHNENAFNLLKKL